MERKKGYDFIRAVSAFGIIAHHFGGELSIKGVVVPNYIFDKFANCNFGWYFVTLFFILSGCMMRMNYPVLSSRAEIIMFYKKRWMAIFPLFFVIWLLCYLDVALSNGNFLYAGSPIRFLWTLVGMDGYFSLRFPNYALIGEWFLGAMVILYLLYPLVAFLWEKNKAIFIAGLTVLFFVIQYNYKYINIQTGSFRSITSCLLSFCFGMLFIDYYKYLNKIWIYIICMVIALLYLYVKIPMNTKVAIHLFGMITFIALYGIGDFIAKNKYISTVILFFSRISYSVFLLQHVVICRVVGAITVTELSEKRYLFYLLCTAIVIVGLSYLATIVGENIIPKRKNKNL